MTDPIDRDTRYRYLGTGTGRVTDNIPPITHQVKPRKWYQFKLHAPPSFESVWKTFVAAMERDGSSASAQVRKWVLDWAKKHAPGNPQTPLERYSEPQPRREEISLTPREMYEQRETEKLLKKHAEEIRFYLEHWQEMSAQARAKAVKLYPELPKFLEASTDQAS